MRLFNIMFLQVLRRHPVPRELLQDEGPAGREETPDGERGRGQRRREQPQRVFLRHLLCAGIGPRRILLGQCFGQPRADARYVHICMFCASKYFHLRATAASGQVMASVVGAGVGVHTLRAPKYITLSSNVMRKVPFKSLYLEKLKFPFFSRFSFLLLRRPAPF